MLGLHSCRQASSSGGERGLLFLVVSGILTLAASLAAEDGQWRESGLQELRHVGLVAL